MFPTPPSLILKKRLYFKKMMGTSVSRNKLSSEPNQRLYMTFEIPMSLFPSH